MEIIKSYPVNRIMHTRPTTEVARAAIHLYEQYRGLGLTAMNPIPSEDGTRLAVNCSQPEEMVANQIGQYKTVEIRAFGEFPIPVLEKCADEIGEVFSRNSDEIPFADKIFKEHFGDYVDDEFP